MDSPSMSDAASPFFQTWMAAWGRKLAIARLLGPVHSELEASLPRTDKYLTRSEGPIPTNWTPCQNMDRSQFERALLAIDFFPRCVLLLSICEKLSLDDLEALLGASKKVAQAARLIGLAALTWNLARASGWVSERQMGVCHVTAAGARIFS